MKFAQLVDIGQIRQILEAHHELTRITLAVLDTDEKVLIAVGWQDLCTAYHRVHPVACQRCQESDAYIKRQLQTLTGEFLDYRCRNGLRDVAMPIKIAGEHVATFFIGQFFYEDDKPDEEYFRAQGRMFGFDEAGYLAAVRRIPVLSRDHIRHTMRFYRTFVQMLAESGLKNLELAQEVQERQQAEAALRRSESLMRSIFETIPDQLHLIDREFRIQHSNWRVWHEHFPEHRRRERPHCFEVFFGAAEPCKVCHVAEAFATSKAVVAEKLNPRIGYVEIRTYPVFDEKGEVVSVLEHIRDINDQKRQERELLEAQSEAVANSRKAGMAEIASAVLHNVGNVLNSVNVSANLVMNRIQDTKAGGLARAIGMMKEHSSDLADFLTADERGKLLPGYLSRLAEVLAEEQRAILEELRLLTKSIDHIKEIVATQQVFAGAASVIESVHVADLVQDAVRMNEGGLASGRVTVVQQIGAMPALSLDKTRVLQILVNLVSNASHAVRGLAGDDRRVVVRADVAGGHLVVAVADEGEGISPENVTRIFNHGFTTRKDGHGFGLHSCALAAKAMGGVLTVHSDGPGRGATFTLDVPVQVGAP